MTASILSGRLRVLATGASLPGNPVSSHALLDKIKQNFDIHSNKGKALVRLLGVETRHFSRAFNSRLESPSAGLRNPDLASQALLQAIQSAKISVQQLNYIVGHTASPASLMPPNIAEVAALIDFSGPCAELRQACTGFANALQLVAGMLMDKLSQPVAIVGSEVGSVFFDPLSLVHTPEQWVNLMQMGDGAGAIILGYQNLDDDLNHTKNAYLESMYYGRLDGDRKPGFAMHAGGSDFPAMQNGFSSLTFSHDYQAVKSNGGDLFKAGIVAITNAGYQLDDFRFIIPHQVSGHIGSLLAHELNIPLDRFFVNAHLVGNLGSAAIWVALHQLRQSGLLSAGDKVLILGAEATHFAYGGFVYVHGASD